MAYFNFESVFKPLATTVPDPIKSYNMAYEKHEPCSYSYVIIDYHGNVVVHECKHPPDAAYKLVLALKTKAKELLGLMTVQPLNMTERDEQKFE